MTDHSERPSPSERADLFIAEYQQKYTDALTLAREAAATTQTAAWQANYADQTSDHESVVNQCLDRIRSMVDTIGTNDTREEDEKSIRDAVKQLADERVRHQAWRTRSVDKYVGPVESCRALITDTNRAARDAEKQNPLHARGLAEEIESRVQRWPVPVWHDDTGVIEIVDGSTGEISDAA